MINLTINGNNVEAQEGATLLDAIKSAGYSVPTLCHMKDMTPTGACRMCVVEVEGRHNLVPSCAYPVEADMVVNTHSERALAARKTITELLLANHPDDCNYCKRNANCELQDLASELWVRQRRFGKKTDSHRIDMSSPSIVRDPDKCILCGRCVRMCEEVQSVGCIDFIGRGSESTVGTAFDEGLNISSCIYCGQCITVCPTGALSGKRHIEKVTKALADPDMHVVVQHAPAVSVTIAEEFGVPAGEDFNGKMVTAMRRLGFDKVFDTSWGADMTIMEEAAEFVHRFTTGGVLPMTTSCSPGWVKFVEQFFPEMLPNISTCKSPHQMVGATIKSYYSKVENIDPKKIFTVSIMPCTAKKFESQRPEMEVDGNRDVDAVINTRELAQLIKMHGLDMCSLEPEVEDNPMGERSSAGKIFGASGGVMEAALRTAYFMITGEELGLVKIQDLRGFEGVKQATVDVKGTKVNVAVVSGLGNARALMEKVKDGTLDIHFVEVMTCPGGCINGGGQPFGHDPDAAKARMAALYKIDAEEELRVSHKNETLKQIYKEHFGEPLGEMSHKLLHTHYDKRDVLK